MDGVSLAVSLLPPLFHLGEAGYKFLHNFKGTGSDYHAFLIKLEIEQRRFHSWGEANGVTNSGWNGLGNAAYERIALDTLCIIVLLFDDAAKLVERYGLQRDSNDTLDEAQIRPLHRALTALQTLDSNSLSSAQPIAEQLDRYREILKLTHSSISLFERWRWALTDRSKFKKLVSDLKSWNDALFSVSSKKQQAVAAELSQFDMLNTSDRQRLDDISAAEDGDASDLGVKAALKSETLSRLPVESQTPISQGDLQFDDREATNRSLALWTMSGVPRSRVMVEWKRKGFVTNAATSRRHDEIVLERLQKLVKLLGSKSPETFRTLSCAGYYLEASEVGLVFELPSKASGIFPPLSLSKLLEKDRKQTLDLYSAKPPLEERFRLAHSLAVALSGLHIVGWLHKGISAENILFFPQEECLDIDISCPYVTGFDFSRESGANSLSETSGDFQYNLYRHPKHLLGTEFDKSYDIYALGLVLIQVALWEPLEKLASLRVDAEKNLIVTDHSELRKILLDRCIKNGMMRYRMGDGYTKAVNYCLNMGFGLRLQERPASVGSFFSTVICNLNVFS